MGNDAQRTLLIAIGMFVVCAILSFGYQHFQKKAEPNPIKYLKSGQPQPNDSTLKTQADTSAEQHPYGKTVLGSLFWEQDPQFLAACAKYGVTNRLAAFQTTLPDPLPGEEANVAHAADLLRGTVISSGQIFSMNATVGPYSQSRGFHSGPAYVGAQVIQTVGGGVCKIASTIYNVVILANQKVVERWPHGMPVPYVPAGQDATVSQGVKDIKFKNTTNAPLLVWADTKENTLYIGFYGRYTPPRISWHHTVLHRVKAPVVYRYNPKLGPGEQKVVVSGADGLTVKSWLTVVFADGREEKRELGIDHYRPLPHVIERGKR